MMKQIIIALLLSMAVLLNTAHAQQGLVAHWSFDTIVANQFKDHVTNSFAGTVYGCESIPGPVGNALSFDGNDDYARVPEGVKPPPQVFQSLSKGSISLWFKVENIPMSNGIRPIFYYGRQNACDFFDAANEGMIIEVGHSPIHNQSRRLYFTEWTNGCTFPSFCYDSWNPIIEGEWYHFVAVVGDDFNTGYLNGQEMHDRKYNFGTESTHEFFSDAIAHENLWIGKGYWDSNSMLFKGAIDEIKIFNRPLTQVEIDTLYWEGNPITTAIPNIEDQNKMIVYPNPGQEFIKLKFPENTVKTFTINIYHLTGELLQKSELNGNQDDAIVNIAGLPPGLFVYTLSDKTHIFDSGKFIKQ